MGKEFSIGFDDTSLSLPLNIFLYYHEFSFEELKLFLEFYASYVTFVGNVMVNPFTCDLAFDIDHMLHEFMWFPICGKKMDVTFEIDGYQLKTIKDWSTSKSAFEVGSFHGFTSFYKKSIKDLSTIAKSLIDVPKKMIGFIWETCSPCLEFAHNSTILYSSFEKTMEFLKYILFKDHDAIDANNMMFETELLTVGPAPTVASGLLLAPCLEVANLLRMVGSILPSPAGLEREKRMSP
ncbi:hypothetical protein M9H77_12633 [Catharanthus roseus]|uniref:Uncharacterized protein n=1 Tax=Catharanthus roseus TaxID=4058 RepID=A0ACC0BHZ7_CATRO|nr:hypothetical protein M9H77_12633 [Catharanthus roseus]